MRSTLLASASLLVLSMGAAFASGNNVQVLTQGGNSVAASQSATSSTDYITQTIHQPAGTAFNDAEQEAKDASDHGSQTIDQDTGGVLNHAHQIMDRATRSTPGRNSQSIGQHGGSYNRAFQGIFHGDDNVQVMSQTGGAIFMHGSQVAGFHANGNTQTMTQTGGNGFFGHAEQKVFGSSSNQQTITQTNTNSAIAEQKINGWTTPFGGNVQTISQTGGGLNQRAYQTVTGYNGNGTEDNNQHIDQNGFNLLATQTVLTGHDNQQTISQINAGNIATQSITNGNWNHQTVTQTGFGDISNQIVN